MRQRGAGFLRGLLFVGVMAWAGCGATTRIESVKAPTFKQQLTELFLLSTLGVNGEVSSEMFASELSKLAARCAVKVAVEVKAKLDLTPRAPLQRLLEAGAKQVLFLEATGGLKDQYGNIQQATYDAQLVEIETEQMVWRASMTLNLAMGGTGQAGAVAARDLLNQLSQDGVVSARCFTETVKYEEKGQQSRNRRNR